MLTLYLQCITFNTGDFVSTPMNVSLFCFCSMIILKCVGKWFHVWFSNIENKLLNVFFSVSVNTLTVVFKKMASNTFALKRHKSNRKKNGNKTPRDIHCKLTVFTANSTSVLDCFHDIGLKRGFTWSSNLKLLQCCFFCSTCMYCQGFVLADVI